MNKLSASAAVGYGWNTFKANPGFLIGLVFIGWVATFVVSFILGVFGSAFEELNPAIGSLIALILLVISYVISFTVSVGMTKGVLNLIDTGKGDLTDLYKHYNLVVSYILASILYTVAIVVGLFLLIIPGLYLIYKLSFYSYFLVDKKLGPVDSLKASFNAVNGVFVELLVFTIFIIVINVLGALALGVGLLVSVPVTLVSVTYVYRKLAADSNQQTTGTPTIALPPDSQTSATSLPANPL